MYMKNKYQKSLLWEDLSGHLSNIHQPRLSEIMEFQLPFEVRSCGASIIWPDGWIEKKCEISLGNAKTLHIFGHDFTYSSELILVKVSKWSGKNQRYPVPNLGVSEVRCHGCTSEVPRKKPPSFAKKKRSCSILPTSTAVACPRNLKHPILRMEIQDRNVAEPWWTFTSLRLMLVLGKVVQ